MITFKTGSPPRADLRWADPQARAANDRRLAFGITPLAGSEIVDDLERALAWPASWIAKAVWSAAGRDRCRGNGAPNTEQRTRLSRLIAASKPSRPIPSSEKMISISSEPVKKIDTNAAGKPAMTISMALRNTWP